MKVSKRRNKREQFFLQGARAIQSLFNETDQIYACPICGEAFDRDEVESNGMLSLEHAPPKAVGGAGVCLTCKLCNNTSGTRLDAEFAKMQQILIWKRAINTGKGSFRSAATVTLAGTSTHAQY